MDVCRWMEVERLVEEVGEEGKLFVAGGLAKGVDLAGNKLD